MQEESVLLEQSAVHPLLRACTRALLLLCRPLLLHRIRRPVIEEVNGVPFVLVPDVQNPVVFRSGAWFAQKIAALGPVNPESSVLDMGTGSGICAVFAARLGYRVVGIDINPEAIRCAGINVLLNQMEDRIDIREGDLFLPVMSERFDLVLFNPPFFRGQPKPGDLFDLSWRSTDVFERFAAGLQAVLKPGGRALVLLSTDGNGKEMLKALKEHNFRIESFASRNFGNEIMTIYAASAAS